MFFVKNSLMIASLLLVVVIVAPSVIGESKKFPPPLSSTEIIPVASSTAEPLSTVVQPGIKGKYFSDIYIYICRLYLY